LTIFHYLLSVTFLTEHKKYFSTFVFIYEYKLYLRKSWCRKLKNTILYYWKNLPLLVFAKKIFKGFISQLRHFGMWKRPFPFFQNIFLKDQQSLLFTKTTISLLRDRNCTFGYQGNKIYVFNHKLGNWKTDIWKVFLWKVKGAIFSIFMTHIVWKNVRVTWVLDFFGKLQCYWKNVIWTCDPPKIKLFDLKLFKVYLIQAEEHFQIEKMPNWALAFSLSYSDSV